jgi:GNAT superfamily N-acetyltransferase
MNLHIEPATTADIPQLAALHTAVAEHLTEKHGDGPWSSNTTETGMHYALRNSHVFIARVDNEIIATLRLTAKKPWAIDTSYFSPARKPLYLLAMAVTPMKQHQGIGTRCLKEAQRIAREWPADVLRLDAYDAKAGAGGFYAKCGWKETGRATYRGAPLIYFEFPI